MISLFVSGYTHFGILTEEFQMSVSVGPPLCITDSNKMLFRTISFIVNTRMRSQIKEGYILNLNWQHLGDQKFLKRVKCIYISCLARLGPFLWALPTNSALELIK